jgi:hypothetical protein
MQRGCEAGSEGVEGDRRFEPGEPVGDVSPGEGQGPDLDRFPIEGGSQPAARGLGDDVERRPIQLGRRGCHCVDQPVLLHLPKRAFDVRIELPGEEGEVMNPEERQAGEPTNCVAC